MHIGNLRTALYGYLYAKKEGGKFILRLEDTDAKRYVEDAVQIIYDTLRRCRHRLRRGPGHRRAVRPVRAERARRHL